MFYKFNTIPVKTLRLFFNDAIQVDFKFYMENTQAKRVAEEPYKIRVSVVGMVICYNTVQNLPHTDGNLLYDKNSISYL